VKVESKPRRKKQRASPAVGEKPRSAPALLIYALLLLATFATYAPVRHFDFVNYDDPDYVSNNPHVREGLTSAGLRWAITSGDAANWLPLTRISEMVDVELFRLDSGMHHLVNVGFHALAAILLFAFLHRATRALWPSAFVAFLFALHPLHVESVAWISERKDVLSACFWFLALWAYVRYAERPRWGRYLVVAAALCLGLMAKPMLVTLPFVLLLLDIWPLRRKAIQEKISLFAIAAAAAVVTYLVQQGSRAVKTVSVFPIGLRVENALVSYAVYLGKLFWPSGLAVFYPYPHQIPLWEPVLSGLLLLGISALVLRVWQSHPYLAVGWFWFLGTLVPVIGLVQVGAQARADRYMYIPMVGLLIMLAWGAADALKRWPSIKPALMGAAAGICVACVFASSRQIQYWQDSETLFTHALDVTNGNYVAQHNLGLAIADQPGRLPEAIEHYKAALAIRPDSVEAHSDLGNSLSQMGDSQAAVTEYQAALRLAPDSAIPHNNLGNAFFRMGRLEEAIAQYKTAVRLKPDYADAYNNLGAALASLGRTQEAIAQFQAALRIQPDYAQARTNLDLALKQR
jgi:tetratricopeptide (TPR) repeat protein